MGRLLIVVVVAATALAVAVPLAIAISDLPLSLPRPASHALRSTISVVRARVRSPVKYSMCTGTLSGIVVLTTSVAYG